MKIGKKKFVKCKRCGKRGWLLYKPIRSYYTPKYDSAYFQHPGTKRLSKDGKKVRSKVYWYTYVVHYGHNKYLEQKQQFESGTRKSKPNGHRSCYIPINGKVKTKKKSVIATQNAQLKELYERQTNRFEEGRYQGEYNS